MRHVIITHCSENYAPVLEKFRPSWEPFADEIVVYSDTEKLGRVLNTSPPNTFIRDWRRNMERKVLSIQRALKEFPGCNITYLDSDCWTVQDFSEVYDFPFEVAASRIVHRKDRPKGEKEANAGVIFMRSSERTEAFVSAWWKRLREYGKIRQLERYHEQSAFSHLFYEAFDGLREERVVVLSERIYNLEHDDRNEWLKMIKKYHPKIIHFKNQWWKDQGLTRKVVNTVDEYTHAYLSV